MSRRQLLNAAWKLGAAAVLQRLRPARFAQPVFSRYPFTLGVASGDPLARRRRAVDAAGAGPAQRRRHADGAKSKSAGRSRATARSGRSIGRAPRSRGRSSVTACTSRSIGLQPGREYWYRFRAGERSQPDRPHQDRAAANAPPSIGCALRVCGCSHFETGYFTAYRRMAEEHFDFVFHTGDYIYEDRADGGRSPAAVRQHHSHEIFTVVDYRNRYAQYKSDRDLRRRTRPRRSS